MTAAVRRRAEAERLFDKFHDLVTGKLAELDQKGARLAARVAEVGIRFA
jgi:hypothetical protein